MARAPRSPARIDALAARVRWLDRYRRLLSLAAAAVFAPFLISWVTGALGAEWPPLHASLLAVMLAVIAWWFIEVGLVYLIALWETEHERLVRNRGLPRAVLIKTR